MEVTFKIRNGAYTYKIKRTRSKSNLQALRSNVLERVSFSAKK